MNYETVSSYWVIDEIKRGKKVFVLDRKLKKIHTVNDAAISDVIASITSEEKGRYVFWYEEEDNGKL